MFHVKHDVERSRAGHDSGDALCIFWKVSTVLRSPPKGSSKRMLCRSMSLHPERLPRRSSRTAAPFGPCMRMAMPLGASNSPLTFRNPRVSESPRVMVSSMGGIGCADRSSRRLSITWTSVSFRTRTACLKKFARLRRGSTRYTRLSGSISLIGIPGNPAPLPMSRMLPSRLKMGTTERQSRK